ncbi:nitrate- and nitrite sensing domain-containing protein [Streptomyces sp. NPDC005438]|uniref:nitrate- and nitrite sensing domain-containing protein n=1 Tax=Streptomyces sp. NPDC005438 TaxID=3156880 RepID=UPI0033BEBEF2
MRRSKKRSAQQSSPETRGNFSPPSAAVAQDSPDTERSGSRFAVRNWRVPVRLNAILLIPVVVALVFGGLRVQSSIDTWRQADDARRTAELVRAAAKYGTALLVERDVTAEPLLDGRKDDPVVAESRQATDRARKGFRRAVGNMPDQPGLKRRLDAVNKAEPRLEPLRAAAYSKSMDGAKTEEAYVAVQHPLMEFANHLGLGTGNVTSFGRTVYAISLAQGAVSLQRALGTHLLVRPDSSEKGKKAQLTALASYAYLERIALGEYNSGGRPEDERKLKSEAAKALADSKKRIERARNDARAKGQKFVTPPPLLEMVKEIGGGASASDLRKDGITRESYYAAATSAFDTYGAVERDLTEEAVSETSSIASSAQRRAIMDSATVLAALLLAFVIAGLMARSMSHNMRRLRGAAFEVAEERLPALVNQLSRTHPGRVDTRIQPIPIDSGDEIGEVARAFDRVHREAVRLAAEQALLRGNVNAIFTNLSRRNEGLIERQLEMITRLENKEADPDQLESLFKMDHLATRMRRNGENLLVLAGEEPGRRWTQPVPLVDVLRAASSEVEHYDRIHLSGIPETEIHGAAVNDLVHLLAELLENATSFSSPQTKVEVLATRLPDGRVMIEIHDKGIGLTAEDFADINHKLANPPRVDVSIAQRMGLFVVGRLAERHGIRVQLRPSGEQAGTTSLVMLPEAITRGGGGEEESEEDFTVSRIVPEHPSSRAGHDSTASAAELGFDDSRYQETPLDPVSRAQARNALQAAMESRQDQARLPRQSQGADGYRPDRGSGQAPPVDGGAAPVGGWSDPSASWGGRGPVGYTDQPVQDTPPPGYDQGGYHPYEDRVPQPETGWLPVDSGQVTGYPRDESGDWDQSPARGGDSAPDIPAGDSDHVGFGRSGPAPSGYRATTGSGLPVREPGRAPQVAGPDTQRPEDRFSESPGWDSRPELPAQGASVQPPSPVEGADEAWRSANDERWRRAEQARQPEAGGVTTAGLPRRVPRANLIEGAAEEVQGGGPEVSRAPEDVRGRLSNLHRGVRRGRTAGADRQQNDRQGFGPGSTYDQER